MFNDEQKRKIAKAIIEHLGEYRCPMCQSNQFSIIEELGLHMMRPIANPSNVTWGVPYIMLVCGKCGNMTQHNAISLGILNADSAKDLISTFAEFDKQSFK